ncbi:MAG: hypothetical protein Q9195_003346 [Heterodermia aff. obscurata]
MADEEPASQPPSLSRGERRYALTGWGKFFSAGKKASRHSDPELGLGRAPNKAAEAPPGYPRIAALRASDDDLMIYRRFGSLHARVLLYRQDELACLERQLEELDDLHVRDGQIRGLNSGNQHNHFEKHSTRITLLRKIRKKLSAFDSVLLGMKSLTDRPKPSSRQYHSVRRYLQHGPPIHLTETEATDPRWLRYEEAVQKILDDPATAPWLDGPLDPDWTATSHRQLDWYGRVEADHRSWERRMEWKLDDWAIGGGILFWISHITAALGFALIANTVSEANRRPTVDWLLGYWYLTTVSIVVQGILARLYV